MTFTNIKTTTNRLTPTSCRHMTLVRGDVDNQPTSRAASSHTPYDASRSSEVALILEQPSPRKEQQNLSVPNRHVLLSRLICIPAGSDHLFTLTTEWAAVKKSRSRFGILGGISHTSMTYSTYGHYMRCALLPQ